MFVSIIIPTYKRSKDLEIALDSLCEQMILPNETIIVDQSPDDDTKILCMQKKYKKINMRYFGTDDQSGARARNQGIEKLDKKSDIVCFFDDDVKIYPDYIKEVISFFENNKDAYGTGGNIINSPHSLFWRIFFFFRKHIMGDTMNEDLSVIKYQYITSIASLVGCAMSYRASIIGKDIRFPDWMKKYSYAEDLFFSSLVNQKYPGSLYYLPMTKIEHYRSISGRMPNQEKIKQILLHYFIYYYNSNRKFRYWLIFFTTFIYYIFSYTNPKMIISLFFSVLKYIYINKRKIINNPDIINKFIYGK